MVSCHRAALAFASRGVPVFPCRTSGKEPLTAHGFKDASTDPAVIERWYRCWPSANVAVPTGLRSGLFVVDVDRHKADGTQALAELEERFGTLPETLTVRTWSGGEHRYFRMPPQALRNSAGKLGPGLDTRGEGGYVLCPPSAIDGRAYAWTVRAAPAELPSGWLEALLPPPRQEPPAEPWIPATEDEQTRAGAWCLRALQCEARELADTPAGSRNDRLWRAAAALGGLLHVGTISADDVRRALTWACSTWEARDARKDRGTLERGLAFGRAQPRRIQLRGDRAA